MKNLYPLLLADNKEDVKEKIFSSSLLSTSLIANGFLKGNLLEESIDAYLGNLVGDKVFDYYRGMIPFEIKRRCYKKEMNVTISPSDEIAISRWMCFGKARIFYILNAPEDSTLYIGFQEDVTAQQLYDKMLNGEMKSLMNQCRPFAGELYFIEGNIPFAIGKGVDVLEISYNSPIEMDIENPEIFAEALDFITLNKYIPKYEIPENESLSVETITLTKPNTIAPNLLESCIALFVIKGKVSIYYKGSNLTTNGDELKTKEDEAIELSSSGLTLIPQELNEITITPKTSECELLRVHLKNLPQIIQEDEGFDHDDYNDSEHHDINDYLDHNHHTHNHEHHHHHDGKDEECDCKEDCDDDCDCKDHHNNSNLYS